jgi:hypothetical protein
MLVSLSKTTIILSGENLLIYLKSPLIKPTTALISVPFAFLILPGIP